MYFSQMLNIRTKIHPKFLEIQDLVCLFPTFTASKVSGRKNKQTTWLKPIYTIFDGTNLRDSLYEISRLTHYLWFHGMFFREWITIRRFRKHFCPAKIQTLYRSRTISWRIMHSCKMFSLLKMYCKDFINALYHQLFCLQQMLEIWVVATIYRSLNTILQNKWIPQVIKPGSPNLILLELQCYTVS